MTDKQYTTDDLANAMFARHPSGSIAARFDDDFEPWRTTTGRWISDAEMAYDGWVPVREAADQPITLDALRDAWENAEQADECNEGDVLIYRHPSNQFDRVEAWRSGRSEPVGIHTRILHRAPKPTPGMAERLEGAVEEWCHLVQSEEPPPLTDWLAARGILVTTTEGEGEGEGR